MDTNDVVGKLKQGQHLVLTGGSPLRQQEKLIQFLYEFMERYNFKPYIEIENECTLMPFKEMIEIVDCWNNSPKLQNSWNLHELRYKPEVLKQLSGLQNSWFKFVVSEEKDWEDIVTGYLIPSLIRRDQVILMPMAGNRAELEANRPVAIKMAIENNVRYSTREHVEIWDQLTGV